MLQIVYFLKFMANCKWKVYCYVHFSDVSAANAQQQYGTWAVYSAAVSYLLKKFCETNYLRNYMTDVRQISVLVELWL